MFLTIKFGTVAGQFEVKIVEENDRKVLYLQGYSTNTIPVSWGVDEGCTLTQSDLEELRTMLEPITRVFDKKVSEAIGHFMADRRG